jgi:ribosomal protein S13
MALKKEAIETIAKLAKLTPEALTAAIADEKEVDVAIPEKLTVLTEDEVTTLKTNTYNDGKKAGVEMEIKGVKEELGLEFQGKSIKGLLEAHGKKVLADAKIDPDKKVKELEEKLGTVQKTATELQTKLTEKESEVSAVKTEAAIVKDMPATTLPSNKVLLLMKADGYEYKSEDGKIIWYKDGKALTDNLSNNLATKAVVEAYATEHKMISANDGGGDPAGRGGGDKKNKTGKYSTLTELKDDFKEQKKSLLGKDFSDAVAKAVKDNPEFDMSK